MGKRGVLCRKNFCSTEGAESPLPPFAASASYNTGNEKQQLFFPFPGDYWAPAPLFRAPFLFYGRAWDVWGKSLLLAFKFQNAKCRRRFLCPVSGEKSRAYPTLELRANLVGKIYFNCLVSGNFRDLAARKKRGKSFMLLLIPRGISPFITHNLLPRLFFYPREKLHSKIFFLLVQKKS